MNRVLLFAAVVSAIGLSAAHAEVQEISGKLIAVDLKERTITIQGKTLDVPRKCIVVVEGQPADFAALKAGQNAVVKYDDTVEVATTIAIGDSSSGQHSQSLSLFNGTNLSGWKYLGNEGQVSKAWSVKSGGVLECSGADDIAPLISDQKYKNFTLALEWRFPPGVTPSKDGIGVSLRMDQSTAKQLRYQLQDGNNSHLWAISQSEVPKALLGSIVQGTKQELIRGPKVAKKPLGSWNTLVIDCEGEQVVIQQNDEETIHVSGVDSVAGVIGFVPAKTKVEIRKVILTPK